MELLLERFAYTPMGTFGYLSAGDFDCYTIERPWEENARFVSCIPRGTYPLRMTRYNRGGYKTYEVGDVPNRDRILIHVGNTMDDLMGCIAPGRRLGCLGGNWAVLSSKPTFEALMKALSTGRGHKLTIVNHQP